MGELEGKINKLLSSPEDMKKIMSLAQSLSSGEETDTPEPAAIDVADNPTSVSDSPTNSGQEPEISPEAILDGLDKLNPETLSSLGSMMEGLTEDADEPASLLGTIEPLLKDKRLEQLKKAMSMAKMVKLALSLFSDSDKQ